PDPRVRRLARPDDRDGDPRRAGRRDRRQDPLPRRRVDRERPFRRLPVRGHPGDGGARPVVTRFALRGLWSRKLRSVLTALAVVVGVALVSGTFVLTDSISSAFDTIFSSVYRGTDATITGKSAVSSSSNTDLPAFDESLLDKVRALPAVAAVTGGVADAS